MMPLPMMPGMQPPAGIGAPPTAPPGVGAGASPLSGLAGKPPGGGLPNTAVDLMTFMAGMGATAFAQFIEKIRNPGGKAGGKTALGKEAAGNPAQVPPGLMALMAQKGGLPSAPGGASLNATPPMNPLAALAAR